jgi:hypothetical protein
VTNLPLYDLTLQGALSVQGDVLPLTTATYSEVLTGGLHAVFARAENFHQFRSSPALLFLEDAYPHLLARDSPRHENRTTILETPHGLSAVSHSMESDVR